MLLYLAILTLTKTRLLPPWTKIPICNKKRKTWGTNALDGWYVGPPLQYYRCYTYINSFTGRRQDVATVEFILRQIPIPSEIPDTYLHQVATYLLFILQTPPTPIPGLTYNKLTTNIFIDLTKILRRRTTSPPIHEDHVPSPRV